ncbi:MAG: anti-sigma regulatory factor [Legionella sp.]|nr:anti-sigma regulatory factor [Legionella sp.]
MDNLIKIKINTEHDIVTARQTGREMAKEFGFPLLDLALIATAISELTRNIISYAQEGSITIETFHENNKRGIVVISKDKGPGIENIDLAMQAGYSTTNSLGLGLPGVKRLMDDFEIKSELGKGTTITIKKWMN